MSREFKIKEVKVTDGPEVEVTIMCKSAQVNEFEHKACFPYNTTKEVIIARLEQISSDVIDNKLRLQEEQATADQEIEARRDKCKALKDKINKIKG